MFYFAFLRGHRLLPVSKPFTFFPQRLLYAFAGASGITLQGPLDRSTMDCKDFSWIEDVGAARREDTCPGFDWTLAQSTSVHYNAVRREKYLKVALRHLLYICL